MPIVTFNLATPPTSLPPGATTYTNQALAADRDFLVTLGINAATLPAGIPYISGTSNFATLLSQQLISNLSNVNFLTPGLFTNRFLATKYNAPANKTVGSSAQNNIPLSSYLQFAAALPALKTSFDQLLVVRSVPLATRTGPFTAVTWPTVATGGLHNAMTTNHLTAWKLSAGEMIVDSLIVRNLTALESISAKNVTTDGITAINGLITDLDVITLSAQYGIIDNLTATNLTSDIATINSVIATSINTDSLTTNNTTINQNLTVLGNVYAGDYFYLDGTRVGGGGDGPGTCCTSAEFIDPVEYVNIYNLHYTDRPALTVTQFGDNPVAKFYDVSGHPERNIVSVVAGGLFDGRPTYSGEGFALALDGEKSLYRWGVNSEGQLGNGNTLSLALPDYAPSLKLKQVSTKGKHVLAIGADNKLYAWGYNQDGQLGNGQDATNTVGSPNKLIATLINSDTDWLYVSAGGRHSAAIKSDGGINRLYLWGNNLSGQIGNGTVNTLSHPGIPTPTVVGQGFVKVACGGNHTLALDSSGKLWAWGSNSSGQLGNASTTNANTPQLISSGPFVDISAGNNFSAAIDAAGNLETWGENVSGQLGNRTTANSLIPTTTALAGTVIRQISCGHQHAAAIDSIGRLFTWGYNQEGELGTGFTNLVPNPNPQDVSAGKVFKYCFAGTNCTYAIDVDGNVWSWGANNTFQLGQTLPHISPSAISTRSGSVSSKNIALIIDGSEETPGFVGIKTEHPNCELTVQGDISASGTIYGNILSPLIITDNIIAADSLLSHSEILTAYIHNLTAEKGDFLDLYAANLTAGRATFTDISAHNGIIDSLTSSYISSHDIFVDSLTAVSLSALTLTSHSISTDEITATDAKITHDLTVDGTIFGHFAGSITSPEILVDDITAKHIYATKHLGVGTSLSSVILSHGVDTQLYVDKDAYINGSLTVEGHTTQLNTDVNITESLRITNVGTQTCLTVQQSGGLNVAEFYYSNYPYTAQTPQVAMVICGNAHHAGTPDQYNAGFVGIKTATPNHELTVAGTISATDDIITDTGTVKARNVSATTVTGDNGIFKNLTIDNLFAKNITSDNITVNQDLSVAGTLYAGRIVGPIVSLGTIVTAIRVETDYLSAKDADINVLRTLTSFNVNISATNFTALVANISTANINIENVATSNITTANISAANITAANIKDATISHNLTVSNLICATDVYAEHFHGPFLISTTDLIVENLTATAANISSANITAAHIIDATIDNIHVTSTVADYLTAKSILLGNTDRTTLTIKQSAGNDLVSMYVQPYPYHPLQPAVIPAFFIKGNAYHNPTSLGDPRDYYNAGYVGILTDDPTHPLTVNGSILSMGNNTIEGCHIKANCDVITPFISASSGTILDLNAVSITTETLHAIDDITTDANLHVTGDIYATGTIFGNIVGGFTNTGITILDEVEANKVTTTDLIVHRKIAVDSAPLGDSDKWTAAYYTPVTINLVLDGGGSSVTTGAKGYVEIPFNMTVTGWSIYADVSSTYKTAVSVLSSSFASYPTATPIYLTVPTLNAGTVKNSSTNLTGWSTNLQAGTVLHFGVSAVPVPGGGTAGPTANLLTLSLKCARR